MKVRFFTLGCKVNHYETEAMRELFLRAGWTDAAEGEPADAVIVNTCTVTAVSDGKSRQLLARAHRQNPDALIAAVGCYAEVAPERVRALPFVSLVVGTEGRKTIVERVEAALAGQTLAPIPAVRDAHAFEELSATRDGRTRATLKIQDGCRNYCTYCIIPFARGPIRSRPMESVERELRLLAAEGFREVVLTGIHLASYGLDFPAEHRADLLDVLRLADGIPGLSRVRIGSLEPKYADERFCREAARLPSLCRQFHLSLQSGSDTVLARMNRRYTAEEYAAACARLRAAMPDCAITTDVIAGFVGETEAEHAETMAFVERMGFARIHVFPYSAREGTRAFTLPGHLEKSVKETRARELIALGKRLEEAFLAAQVGKDCEVLVESDGTGYTGNYVRVRPPFGGEGDLVPCRIARIEHGIAIGKERIETK